MPLNVILIGIILVLLIIIGVMWNYYTDEIASLEFRRTFENRSLLIEREACKRLEKLLEHAHKDLTVMAKLIDGTPDDCKRGEWCKECACSGTYAYRVGTGTYSYEKMIFCRKAEVCNNFVPKGDLKDGD